MLKRMFLGLYIYMYSTYVSNGRFLNFRYVSETMVVSMYILHEF